MKVGKIFNNNVILAIDSDNHETILSGRGLAFRKKVGDEVDESLIEKTFILKEQGVTEKFKKLLENVPSEQVSLCYDIIQHAKGVLDVKLNDYIYVTLTDHVNNVLKTIEEGFYNTNILIWEIKKFYPKEFEVGLKALELIKIQTHISLPEDEAANIALHLINAQINNKNNKSEDAVQVTKMIADILNIVKYAYSIELDEKSLSYERFVTHLRFFFIRLKNRQSTGTSGDNFLLEQVKEKYNKAYECMLKVQKYLRVDLNDEEQLYLTLHIQRITQR